MLLPMTSGDPDLGELLESDGSVVIATFSLHKRLSERCGLHFFYLPSAQATHETVLHT